MNVGRRALLGWAALALAGCYASSEQVTRVSHGVPYEGRFIEPEAYAAYLRGVELEAQGELAPALEAYRRAQAQDHESPELWARIGSVQCRSAPPAAGPEAARTAFLKAFSLDAECASAFYERARCAERARELETALSDARQAVAASPDDEHANLLVARLLVASGHRAEARAWLESFSAFQPSAGVSARVLAELRRDSAAPVEPVVERLRAGDDAGARRAAARATLRPSALALLAAQHGRAELAREQAELELDADPSNADAWVAALSSCDLLRDDACFERTLATLRPPTLELSPLARTLLDELLQRRADTTP